MILKAFDSKQESLDTLNRLYKQSSSEKQKALIFKEITLIKNGIDAEKQNAYYIDFYIEKSKNLIVLHDIRLEHKGRTAQIDHMILSRVGIELLESKSFKGALTINDDSSLSVQYSSNTKSFPNPIEQSKRHADVVRMFIEDNAGLSKRIKLLGGMQVDNVVLIHPETIITNKVLPEHFFRADTYISKRTEEIDKTGILQTFKLVSKMIDIESVQELAELFKSAHTPAKFNYEMKYKMSKEPQSVKEKEVAITEEVKETTEVPVEIKSKVTLKEGDSCPFCTKPLVLRMGKNKVSFLGCSAYPRCRFTRRIATQPLVN